MLSTTTIARLRYIGCLLLTLVPGVCAAAGTASEAGDGKECAQASTLTPLAVERASAGYISNFANRYGSIRATSERMLTSALESDDSKESKRQVVFTSTPDLSKKASDDDSMCARQEELTSKEPLEFDDQHFKSVQDLTNWIMDFTQGKGAEGKSLYEQCPGKCSPQYTWWIEAEASGFEVNSRVVCGLPRDRDGDMYELTTALAPACSCVSDR